MDDSLADKIVVVKRKAGRPKGSKNKKTDNIVIIQEEKAPDCSDQMSDCFDCDSWDIKDIVSEKQLKHLDI